MLMSTSLQTLSLVSAVLVLVLEIVVPVGAFLPRAGSSFHQFVRDPVDTNNRGLKNVYDDWRSDAVVDTMHLDEENVEMCLEEFIDSGYGQQMFGSHDRPASIGITGWIEFEEICGPEVTLTLDGKFWHRRETVLGRAAMWLNARMPEITDVMVADLEELKDFEEVLDDFGDVIFRKDKRAPDYNGDREAMNYQGRDPDMRGPFPQGPMGPAGSMINPI